MENKMNLLVALQRFWAGIFDYKSTSDVKEYWLITACHAVLIAIAFIILVIGNKLYFDGKIENDVPYRTVVGIIVAYILVSLIPWVALNVRRLHDTGKSGWWTLLLGIIGIGMAILLVICSSRRSVNVFTPDINMNVCVYGPPEYFEQQDTDGPIIAEPIDIPDLPIEVYGPPEFDVEEDD